MADLERSSGVQLHLTSLPGGRLGREAYRFVDWLADAGQTWWQVLPLGPPDRYRSPYKSASAFAAWRGFLDEPRAPVSAAEIADFRDRQAFWIAGWERHAGRGAIADQVRFDREWGALRRYAADRGVRILGDVAIYVSPGGADHETWPELFQEGWVAGAPPDAYSETGQLWGNPLYDWPALQRRGYRWWVERVRRTLELFDMARIDHFRGLVAYWAVPARRAHRRRRALAPRPGRGAVPRDRARARARPRRSGGRPAPPTGPGRSTFRSSPRISASSPSRSSGCASRSGCRGCSSSSSAWSPATRAPSTAWRTTGRTGSSTRPRTTRTRRAAGWTRSTRRSARSCSVRSRATASPSPARPWWGLIRYTFSSPARVAMVQAQDVLGLGSEARMNQPGRAGNSWRWQLERGALTPALGRRLRAASEEAGD